MYFGRIKDLDTANGIGIRETLFVSGCRNHCKNCFQPETWDFHYGSPFTEAEKEHIIEELGKSYIRGVTFLGGEPMEPENQEGLLKLAKLIKDTYPKKDIWCYTGYTLEQLLNPEEHCHCQYTNEFLKYIDVLVDGRFVDELKDISLRFRGSKNQRVIDLKETLKSGEIHLFLT